MAMLRWSWLVCATLVVAEEGKWPTCLEGGVAYTNLLDAPAEVGFRAFSTTKSNDKYCHVLCHFVFFGGIPHFQTHPFGDGGFTINILGSQVSESIFPVTLIVFRESRNHHLTIYTPVVGFQWLQYYTPKERSHFHENFPSLGWSWWSHIIPIIVLLVFGGLEPAKSVLRLQGCLVQRASLLRTFRTPMRSIAWCRSRTEATWPTPRPVRTVAKWPRAARSLPSRLDPIRQVSTWGWRVERGGEGSKMLEAFFFEGVGLGGIGMYREMDRNGVAELAMEG